MRALLAAVQCDKSALAVNLEMHVRVLGEAARAGCDIAVFPEMSLTGSVDPRSHPEDAISVDDDAIMTLARATHGGVATLFGIARWRDGFSWWERCGLGDARRHARNFGVWVALTTQAGSTRDEEFPGLAALMSPDGDIVARLPDWKPASLVVDVPLEEGR